MAWIRQLESGNWAATVRLSNGRRVTETRPLKGQVERWVQKTVEDDSKGRWIDPADSKTPVAELWERFQPARELSKASRKRDESHWRRHVEPEWGGVGAGSILKPDVMAWVAEMKAAGVGAATIQGSLGVLRALLELAVEARLIEFNPASGVKPPRRPAHQDRVLHPDEDAVLLARVLEVGGPTALLLVELMLYCGLRYEEATAIRRERVLLKRRLLDIGPVQEKDGAIRDSPKSPAGERKVPVDDDLWPRLRDHVMTVQLGGLILTGPRGGPLLYDHFRDRVWQRALLREIPMTEAESAAWRAQRRAAGRRVHKSQLVNRVPLLDDPQPTLHDLRHTYATRLGEQGVPHHEMLALLGHENLESLQRYLHASEDRFDRARAAVRRARPSLST